MKVFNKLKKSQAGFTLVEIAIVMIIIGLLIGGVLKGKAMIQNAKVKRLVSDVDKMRAAVLTYQDKYGMLPGDENDPNTPPGDTFNAGGGNANNGRFDEQDGRELEDLRLAGLLPGTGTTLVNHSFGGTMRVDWIGVSGNNNYIYLTNIPSEVCLEIDSKYDDGVFNTGEIRANGNYNPGNIRALGWTL
ncbi:MAG: prepilin-type N-terminal cleavage/methylation domain-containing protein [Desulfobacterales bacterium]|nr:prepilin-type N-terminal cleavage/methylation domain-containing protein [Desulfobacterales bacterium]